MLKSLKQLLRTPVKALLFLLLLAASTVLLVLGAGLLIRTNARIDAAEGEFKTVGTVTQKPISEATVPVTNTCSDYLNTYTVQTFKEILSPDILNFDGAEYKIAPRNRAYYLSVMPELNNTNSRYGYRDEVYILEFTPLAVNDGKTTVRVTNVLYKHETTPYFPPMQVGNGIEICAHFAEEKPEFELGKTYIATVVENIVVSAQGEKTEYAFLSMPYTTQYSADGMPMQSDALAGAHAAYEEDGVWKSVVPATYYYPGYHVPVGAEEVTGGFYDSPRGKIWLNWVAVNEQAEHLFPVLPVEDLELLTTFHEQQVTITNGREITEEEFKSGARVCMLPQDLAQKNLLNVGDTVTVPLNMALYGTPPSYSEWTTYCNVFSPLNAEGEPYASFWQAEYEIVGLYKPMKDRIAERPDIASWMLILPKISIDASDEDNIAYYGPMNSVTTSFMLPNGTIESFDAALRVAVPETSELTVTYDDNGYRDLMTSLNNARMSAVLLFAGGLIAVVGIVVLLLYFFIVKQKKRTAIERSLGMSKAQCRISLMAGILVLALVASVIGVGIGAVLLQSDVLTDTAQSETEEIDTTFSIWAKGQTEVTELETDATVPVAVYVFIPVCLLVFIFLLSLVLMNRNLKTEPILLLSGKGE